MEFAKRTAHGCEGRKRKPTIPRRQTLKRVVCLNCLWNQLLIQDNVHNYITATKPTQSCTAGFWSVLEVFAETFTRSRLQNQHATHAKITSKSILLILSGQDQRVQVTQHLRPGFAFAGHQSRVTAQGSGKLSHFYGVFSFRFFDKQHSSGVGRTDRGGENTASVACFGLRPRDSKSKHEQSCETATERLGGDHTPNGNTNMSINSRALQTTHAGAHSGLNRENKSRINESS